MAWRLGHSGAGSNGDGGGLITVACHEDLTATDLVGRYLLSGDETVWMDGPLTRAVRTGAICYLDEVVEARKDTTVVIHALSDHRRILPIEKTSELLAAHPDFLLVISYNPGYQSVLKDLKPSTRQRFVSLEFDYPGVDAEASIIAHEGGAGPDLARPHAWRLDVAKAMALIDGPLTWRETGSGPNGETGIIKADPAAWGDVILSRADAPSSYHLSVTLDDALQGVTHVVRGQDLFHATSVHRLLQRLLDLPEPVYHHHRLILGQDRRKLSKSNRDTGIAAFRAAGKTPDDVRAMVL
jgi:hypothetical protein